MIRQRGPFSSAPSKASPQTLCQKCLKRGHYSYECKSSTQERPYASRPSRTQQLTNPKLLPKLTSDVPNELLRKKGVADEELAKKEADRGRKRKLEEDGYDSGPGKRSRSVLSYSSFSTISTNKSRSLSPEMGGRGYTGQSQSMSGLKMTGKRRRSPSRSMSYSSDPDIKREPSRSRIPIHRQPSPNAADRPRSEALLERNGNRKHSPSRRRRSRSAAHSSSSSYDEPPRRRSRNGDRKAGGGGDGKRRRRATRSPEDRGRERDSDGPRRSSRRTYSPSESRDRSEVTRHRKSMTPGFPSKVEGAARPDALYGRRTTSYEEDHDRYGGSSRMGQDESFHKQHRPSENRPPPQRKERSLSPFSKRLALTQAMNMGR